MKRLLLVAAAFGAGWLAKRMRDEGPWPMLMRSSATPPASPATRATLSPRGDDGVLGALAMLDEHQIANAETALNRPLPDAVQTLASMLRDEHRQHLARTRELVDQLGLEPAQDAVVARMERDWFARRALLASANDEDFQQVYLEDVVEDHERMLQLVDTTLAPAAHDARVAEHVERVREHLSMHLAEARMLA